jgi:regulator of protease activity HflC (stomatin/prohibitin superfamily)
MGSLVPAAVAAFVLITCLLLVWSSLHVVREDQRMVVFRLGRTNESFVRGPGLVFMLPIIDRGLVVDTGEQTMRLDQLGAATNDGRGITLDVTLRYRIVDPLVSALAPGPLDRAVPMGLQNALATLTFAQVMAPGTLATALHLDLDDRLRTWGTRIIDLEVANVADAGTGRTFRAPSPT